MAAHRRGGEAQGARQLPRGTRTAPENVHGLAPNGVGQGRERAIQRSVHAPLDPAGDLVTTRGLGFLTRHGLDGLTNAPDMTLRIAAAIGPVAIKLILRFHDDLASGGAGAFAVRVDVVGDVHMDRLGIPSAQ